MLDLLQEIEEKETTKNGNVPNGSVHKPDKANCKNKTSDNGVTHDDEKAYTPEQLAEVKRFVLDVYTGCFLSGTF